LTTLVTGGLGFIGSNLVKALLTEEEQTAISDISSNTKRVKGILDRVRLIRGDVASVGEVLQVVKQHEIDNIFNLAALLTLDCEANPWRALKTNVNGTVNILEVSRLCDVEKVIFPSTRAVFGPGGSKPLSEDDPKRPSSIYGITKLLCEQYGLKYSSLYGLDFRCVRLVMAYGPGRTTGGSSFGTQLIERPAFGEPVQIPYGPDELTDWLYVEDAVKALLMIQDAPKLRRGIYNINGETHSLGEVAYIVRKILPESIIEFIPGTTRLAQVYPLIDDSEARRDLGWSPKFTIKEGVEKHINEIMKLPSARDTGADLRYTT